MFLTNFKIGKRGKRDFLFFTLFSVCLNVLNLNKVISKISCESHSTSFVTAAITATPIWNIMGILIIQIMAHGSQNIIILNAIPHIKKAAARPP